MREDPIVNEVRRRREEFAARFNFDVRSIAQDARKRQQESGRKVITPPRKQAAG